MVLVAAVPKAVVIGNGPSLREHLRRGDFERLAGVETVAMNRIDWLYDPDPEAGLPGTAWRPTRWVWVEYYGISDSADPDSMERTYTRVLERHVFPDVERCYISTHFRKALQDRAWRLRECERIFTRQKLIWVDRCNWHGGQCDSLERPEDWHLPMPCTFGGTINTALSLAFMFGFDDVAVIGCDLGIRRAEGPDDPNHFHPRYHTYLDGNFERQDDTLRHVHSIARRNFERCGRRIVNAGIGGLLEVYDRMPLEEWLCS